MITDNELHEMAFVLSRLSLADTFKLIRILDEEFGIKIINNVVEKPVVCGPAGNEPITHDYVFGTSQEPKLYKVYLYECGPNKLQVVKTIKDLTGLGLRESKEIADKSAISPELIKECQGFEADIIKNKLKKAGAIVTIV